MAEGSITIDVLANTDKFDKQIANLEKKMKKEEQKKINKEVEITNIRERVNEYNELIDKATEYRKEIEKLQEIQAKKTLLNQGIDPQISMKLKEIVPEYQNMQNAIDKSKNSMIALANKGNRLIAEQKELNTNIQEYKNKIEGIKLQKHQADIEKVKNGFKGVGSSIQDAVKKAGKLALGIFAIRSAYMMLRRASSDLASYDQQYATNLEYIRFVLTQAIAPVLRGIVSLVAKLLQYLYLILNTWFGIGAKLNASAESFNKMKKNAGGVGKAVKEIKKQLTGFDEINALTDQSDTGTSAGAGGVGVPDFDITSLEGDIPEWMQWILDNKDKILGFLSGLIGFLVALKFNVKEIKALGIGMAIKGIVDTISALIDYLNDPSWENFGKIIKGIGEFIVGLGIIINSVPVIVAGAIVIILGLIAKNWDKIKEGFNKAIDWIKGLGDKAWKWLFDNIDKIQEKFGYLGLGITAVFVGVFDWLSKLVAGIVESIRDVLDGLFTGVKQIIDGIIRLFKGDLSGIVTIVKGIVNIIIGICNGLISGLNAIIYPIRALIVGIGKVLGKSWTMDTVIIPKIPYVKTGAIVNMPNRGTYIGGAMAGESGREGVLPLTDSQAMAELGREIGRWITVNANIVNTMNGRVISRQLKQIENNQGFAYNT